MSYKDFYQTLGVAKAASQDEIQKAYKKLARKYHPDVSKESGAEDRFKEINEAYDVLKDPQKRGLYDKYGSQWKAISEGRQPAGGPGAPAGFDFRDFEGFEGFQGGGFSGNIDPNDLGSIFEQFFGGQQPGGRGARRRARGPRRGEDRESALELGVRDAYAGGARDLGIRDAETGQTTRLTVKIPGGVRSGQRIRLAGKGGEGGQGAPAGDLFLRVNVVGEPGLRLEGDDVYATLPVAPWEAALGATVTLPTLDGDVRLKVPPGSSSGRNIRLRERGYPKKDGTRGDFFATVQIVVPEQLSENEKELFEKLAETSAFKPR